MIAAQLESDIISQLTRVRAAARELALCSSEVKNRALTRLAGALRASGGAIIAANARDLEQARAQGVKPAFLERLTLNPARIEAMALSVEQVAALPDPVGEVIAGWRRPNGLEINQVRVPIGTIAIVYESRPNVTVEAAVLALKAGNGAVLRGGKESLATNRMLAGLVTEAMDQAGAPGRSAVLRADAGPRSNPDPQAEHRADRPDNPARRYRVEGGFGRFRSAGTAPFRRDLPRVRRRPRRFSQGRGDLL